MDGLNHLQVGDRTYNGFRLADIVEDHGTNRLGIDTLPQVVTRGLLLDVAAARGGNRLPPGEVITEPTSAQREAFDLIGVPIPLTLKQPEQNRPARQNARSSQKHLPN